MRRYVLLKHLLKLVSKYKVQIIDCEAYLHGTLNSCQQRPNSTDSDSKSQASRKPQSQNGSHPHTNKTHVGLTMTRRIPNTQKQHPILPLRQRQSLWAPCLPRNGVLHVRANLVQGAF